MKCPFCGHADTQVIDSRMNEAGDSIRRRRRCLACEKRFTTFETADIRPPQIVKSNGFREDFSEAKVREGFRRALHKRPVPTPLADAAVDRIRQKLLTRGEREVSSREIGELVMHELKRLDKIAYIRFASVYKSFQEPDDFREMLQDLERAPPAGVDDLFE
ncbi:MAG: transcriptional regulator NrdR [Thiobacillus sp.]